MCTTPGRTPTRSCSAPLTVAGNVLGVEAFSGIGGMPSVWLPPAFMTVRSVAAAEFVLGRSPRVFVRHAGVPTIQSVLCWRRLTG
jgi:hypothetical protein